MIDVPLQELLIADDPEERATIIAEFVFSTLPSEVASALRRCVILHWFDQSIIETLLQDIPIRERDSRQIYEQIVSLPFIEIHAWGATFHYLTRRGLLRRYAFDHPDMLKTAAMLAIPNYLTRMDNGVIAAEAFFCYTVVGDASSALKLLEHLLETAIENENWQYINRLQQLQNEAERLPFVASLSLAERHWILRGLAHRVQNNLQAAELDYSNAIAMNPQNSLLYLIRGTIYADQQRYEEALREYRHTARLDPASFDAHINQGIVYIQEHRYEEAASQLSRAVQLHWINAESYKYYLQVLVGFAKEVASSPELLENSTVSHIFREAEPLLMQALILHGEILGSELLEIANSYSILTKLYYKGEKYREIERLARPALTIRERFKKPVDPKISIRATDLGHDYVSERKYYEAEPLLADLPQIRVSRFFTPLPVSDKKPILEIIDKAREGHEGSFNFLYLWYYDRVYTFISRYVDNHDDMDDLTQDIFIDVWRSLSSLRDKSRFESWLFKIARNTVMDFLQKSYKSQLFLERPGQPSVEDLADPTNFEEQVEKSELINQSLRYVLPRYRTCLLLQVASGFTWAEIASFLGISKDTVGTYVSNARKQFRQAYERLVNE